MKLPSSRIEVLGILGVGKTTFLSSAAELMARRGATPCFEDIASIREEIAYWLASRSERTYFVQTAFYTHAAEVLGRHPAASLLVSDFSLLGHHYIYSHTLSKLGYLTALELRTLERMAATLDRLLPPLVGFILCQAPLTVIAERAESRARSSDGAIDRVYLELLQESMDEYLVHCSLPIFRVDTGAFSPSTPVLPPKLSEFLAEHLA